MIILDAQAKLIGLAQRRIWPSAYGYNSKPKKITSTVQPASGRDVSRTRDICENSMINVYVCIFVMIPACQRNSGTEAQPCGVPFESGGWAFE